VEVGAIFGADVFQALFAALGVWIHTAIGTRSMLLAAAAVAQAVVAIPLAHFFYCSVFQARPGQHASGTSCIPRGSSGPAWASGACIGAAWQGRARALPRPVLQFHSVVLMRGWGLGPSVAAGRGWGRPA
jgi:hypothetical protein